MEQVKVPSPFSMFLLNKTRFLVIIFMIITTWIMLTIFYQPLKQEFPDVDTNWVTAKNLMCHADNVTESLSDISDNPPSKKKKNIFFLETSCTSSQKGKIYLSPRQACAVESAARMNPDMEIYLLFASPGVIKDEHSESDRMLKVLSEYDNVKLMHFNLKRYVQDTKVERLWVNGDIQNSNYPITHASDILRFLTLWKYGGIYLDLDVIVTKNLSTLPENFAGVEDNYLGSAALGFGLHQSGREYINDCLEELSTNFDGKNWGNNGPHLITRVMFRRCSQFKQELLIRMGSCEDFIFLPPSAFYLLPYYLWNMYFEEKYKDALMSYVEKSSYLVHIWNKLSVDTPIPKENVNVPYLSFAMKYCPGVVSQIDTVF